MPASMVASEDRVILTFASFGLGTRKCDWPRTRFENEVTIRGNPSEDLRLWLIQSAADWGFEIGFFGRAKGVVRLKPDLLGRSCVAQAAFFGAIDLYDDTVLDDDVHRSKF